MNTNSKDNAALFEKEYFEILKGSNNENFNFLNAGFQWTNPNDFIVKFSLYQDSPNTITTSETTASISF